MVDARSTASSLKELFPQADGMVESRKSDTQTEASGFWQLSENAAYWLFFASVSLLVLTPIIFLIYGSFQDDQSGAWTIQNWARVLGPDAWGTIRNTLVVGVVSAVASTLLGGILAWVLERTDVAFPRLCGALVLASFALPGFILAMAWIIIASRGGMLNAALKGLFGPQFPGFDIYSQQGVIFVLCLHLIPISYLTIRAPIRNLDANLEEAASMCGANNWQTMVRILLPLLRYPIVSGFLLTFVLAVEQFAIPVMIGVPAHFNVMATEMYTLVVFQPPKQGLAAALGLLLAAITSLALFAHAQLARRTSGVTVTGRSYRRTVYRLGWARLPLTIICFLPAVAAAIIPVLALTYAAVVRFPVSNPFEASYTLRAFVALFTTGGMSGILWNTFVVCVVATLLAIALGFTIAYKVQRKTRPSAAFLQSIAAMSFGFPGIVIGMGFIWSYVYLPIYGTLMALILAFTARYLAYAIETVTASLRQLDASLEEAAAMAGASAYSTITKILLPLLRPSLQSASLLLFVSFLREISAAALLYTPSTQVLSISIWTSFENANWARASVLSLLIIVIVFAVTALASKEKAA